MIRIFLFGVLAACSTEIPARSEPLPASAVIQDLTYARDVWAAKDRSFSPEARIGMLAFLAEETMGARSMERTDLALILAQAQAMSGNNHTQSDYFNEPDLFHSLPISFWFFPEGAMVTRAHPSQADLLGAKILRIGGVSVGDAGLRVAKYISGTDQRHRFLTPTWLSRVEVLEAVGLADKGEANFEFQLRDGSVVMRALDVAPTPDPAGASPTWRQSMVPGKGPDPWPHVLDHLTKLPLSVQAPEEFAATTLNDGSVLYVRSNSLSPYTDDICVVQLKAYSILERAFKAARPPVAVIVDLRYNGGGNFLNITNFATEISGLVGPKGHIYVFTGRATNSAAIVFTALLKAQTHGRTKILGEEASDRLWFWSEGDTLQAPASKLPLHYTDGFHDWAHGCVDRSKCYWPAIFHSVAVGTIQPDIHLETTYADYVAGRDPVLEAALALAQTQQ